jgi:predicted transcriptional regulator
MNRGEPEDVFETVARRRELFALLADEPLDKASIVRRLDVSRSTVNRAVSTLESYGFVERVDGRYATTTAGDLAHRHVRETLSTVEGLLRARPLLGYGADLDPPPALFRDATVVTTDHDRHGPVRFLIDLLAGATAVRSAGAVFRNALPTPIRERASADGGLRLTQVMSPTTVERTRTYHAPELRDMITSDCHELRVAADYRPTTVAVVDTGSASATVVVFYDEADEPVGLVHTTDSTCLAWARARIEHAWDGSTSIADAIDLS